MKGIFTLSLPRKRKDYMIFLCFSWVEQKPHALLKSVEDCIEAVCTKLKDEGVSLDRIKGLGITNQRETTIVWDKLTGEPLNNAVVWCDARNGVQVHKLDSMFGQNYLR